MAAQGDGKEENMSVDNKDSEPKDNQSYGQEPYFNNRGNYRGRGGSHRGGRNGGFTRPYNKPYGVKNVNSLCYYVCGHCRAQTKKGEWNCVSCGQDLFPDGHVMCGSCCHVLPKSELTFRDLCWFCGVKFSVRGTRAPFKSEVQNA